MANDYTTSTDVFGEIPEGNFSSSDQTNVAGLVTAASRLIDAEFGRPDGFFYPSTDAQTLYYDGSGDEEQEIDEFVSITQVSVAESGGLDSTSYTDWTLNTDYLTKPYNASVKGKPINRLVVQLYNGSKGSFYSFQKSVKVVGIPGYSVSPPDLVKLAAKIQTIHWFMRGRQAYQDVSANGASSSLIFKGKLELDPDVKALLWPLKLELL